MTAVAQLVSLDARYEVRELLGEGGMGAVYAAWDRLLDRPVALKFIRGADPLLAERLLLEARLQARVEHANVGKVYEVGEHQGRACIALQLIRGKTLEELSPSLPLRTRVELLRQVTEAVHAAHASGLVHRDIKPGNILVEQEGSALKAYVTDFGLARGPQPSGLSRSAVPAGTLLYMSPEQAAGEGAVDFRSDLYSLGASLYTLLVLRPPFSHASIGPPTPRDTPTTGSMGGFYGLFASSGELAQVSLLRQVLEEDPEPPRSIDGTVPRDLQTIALSCLQKEPARRYASAKALADDLSRYLEGRPILARPIGAGEKLARLVSKHRAASLSILLLVLAAGAALAWSAHAQNQRARLQSQREEILHRFDQTILDATYRLQLAHLAPLHDRTPQVQALKASIEEVRADMQRLGSIAEGPGHQAIGMGLLELESLKEAADNLSQSWELGLRSPESAEAFAWSLYLLYGSELSKLFDRPMAEIPALKAALEKRTKLRAIEVLGQASALGLPKTPFTPALLAALKGETDAALEACRKLLLTEPWHERANLLLFQLRNRLAHGRPLAERDRALAESEAALAQLLKLMPSNPSAWHQAYFYSVNRSQRAAGAREARDIWLQALEAARNGIRADPRSPRTLVELCTALEQVATRDVELGESPQPLLDEFFAAYTLVESLLPEEKKPIAIQLRASVYLSSALWKLRHGESADAELDATAPLNDEVLRRDSSARATYDNISQRLTLAELSALAGRDPRAQLERSRALLEKIPRGDDPVAEPTYAEVYGWLALLAQLRGEDPTALLTEAESHRLADDSNIDGPTTTPKLELLFALTHALQDRAQGKSPRAHQQAMRAADRQARTQVLNNPLVLVLEKIARQNRLLD